MKWRHVVVPAVAAAVFTVARVDAGEGDGCGTVQDYKWTGMSGTFYGHSFGEDPSPLGWRAQGEPEPNHQNAHDEFVGGGYHNHNDHPTPCDGPHN
jgi:hypothetical protein